MACEGARRPEISIDVITRENAGMGTCPVVVVWIWNRAAVKVESVGDFNVCGDVYFYGGF